MLRGFLPRNVMLLVPCSYSLITLVGLSVASFFMTPETHAVFLMIAANTGDFAMAIRELAANRAVAGLILQALVDKNIVALIPFWHRQ